jgi:hypothetical protein
MNLHFFLIDCDIVVMNCFILVWVMIMSNNKQGKTDKLHNINESPDNTKDDESTHPEKPKGESKSDNSVTTDKTNVPSQSDVSDDTEDSKPVSISFQSDKNDLSDKSSDKRSTVLTFGVNDESDTKTHRDTAILSENNRSLRRAIHNQAQSGMPEGTATLGENREVIFVIRGMIERVVLNPDIRYKLGRFEMGTKGLDEIDLTPYGALDRGVSRVHAQIFVQDGRLYIMDLDSSNGTYMAGHRLKPNEPLPLRKGDELMLGRLPVQVLFR